MSGFDSLYVNLAADPQIRGRQFELVVKWFLENDPVYAHELKNVWLWSEWEGRWGIDAGIDLVAQDRNGDLWAIQAKAYDPKYRVSKKDVDKFLAESGRKLFVYRMLIATTDLIDRTGERTIQDQEKRVTFFRLNDLRSASVEWPRSPDALRPSRQRKPAHPRQHQKEAIADVVKGSHTSDRGQLIMACGTGKTLTALFITEKLEANRTLVLLPSLSLLKQTLNVWRANSTKNFASLPVCSDGTVASADEPVAHTTDLGVPVTTDPTVIAAFLRQRTGPRIMFSTYQSSPQIAKAFALGRVPGFDLVIADEAHRVAGPVSSDFGTVLDDAAIRGKRRLFMTATPRYFTGRVLKAAQDAEFEYASMDDTDKFGPVFHRLSFGDAIGRDLLTDYQVVVVGVDDATCREQADRGTLVTRNGKNVESAAALAGQIGLAKAMRKYHLHRVISFHSRVARAREFAAELPNVVSWMPARQRPTGTLWARYASGEMPAGDRYVLLQHLGRLDDGQRGLLANARCLTEGVDVPTLDGVAFVDPRRSEVDIIQAVGRAIRKSDTKTVGTIVLPVFIDSDTDAETALDSSVFKPVWDVIKALRAHDAELGAQLDTLRREMGRNVGKPKLPDKIHIDVPATVGTDFAAAFDARLVEQTTLTWEFWYGLLERYVEEHGHARVPAEHRVGDYRLGRWVIKQRTKRATGELSAYRTGLLESLHEWIWDTADFRWDEGFSHLLQFATKHYHTAIPARYEQDGYRLGQWVTLQRQAYGRGELEPARRNRLEEVPGWVWDPIGYRWETGFGYLLQYVGRHGSARISQDLIVDGYRLGTWVATQRGRYRQGKLEIERQERLEALPDWVWEARAASWDETFEVLCRYVEQHGTAAVTQKTIFEGVKLGQWVAVARDSKKNGTLSADRQRRLEGLPGWAWDTLASQWGSWLERLKKHIAQYGTARVPSDYVVDGHKLGRWVVSMRVRKAAGRLDALKAQQLEALPGWTWSTGEEKWEEGLTRLSEYVKANGHARVPPRWMSKDGYKLGLWVANLRARRSGLDPEKARRLEAVPGWSWDPLADDWEDGFRHLLQYVGEYGDARPAREYLASSGFRLGQWVTVQRVTFGKGKLRKDRRERLESLPGWAWKLR